MLYRSATVGMPYRRPRLMATISSAKLGHAVGVLRIGDPLRGGLHLKRAAALRARDVPPARREGAFRPHARQLLAVGRAPVEPFAHR